MSSAGRPTSQRLDQWLWFARIVKSRTLGQALIERGKVRLNRERIEKCAQTVKAGDVITISLGPRVRVIEIAAMAARRGSAPEAAVLYIERTPQPAAGPGETAVQNGGAVMQAPSRPQGAGRPTKRDRRVLDRLKSKGFEP